MGRKHENFHRTSTHHKTERSQSRTKAVQHHIQQKNSGHTGTTAQKTLRFEPLTTSTSRSRTHHPANVDTYGKETMEHYLLSCQKYNEPRKKLQREVEPGKMRVEKLLTSPRLIKHAMEYVATTKGMEI